MLSAGGVPFTERKDPTRTHKDAVTTMFIFVGTGMISGSIVIMNSASCATMATAPPPRASFVSGCAPLMTSDFDISRRFNGCEVGTDELYEDNYLRLEVGTAIILARDWTLYLYRSQNLTHMSPRDDMHIFCP